jgi:hypothetical protein
MNTKTILGISLAAIFAISTIMTVPLADAGGHLTISGSEVNVKNASTLDAKIKVTGKIPTKGGSLFGYALITDLTGFNNVLALTTHAGAFDHSSQSGAPDPVFHAHVLDLAGAGTIGDSCSPASFDAVVDFASSVGSGNNIDAQYPVPVGGNNIKVKNVPVSDLNDSGVEAIVAFTITPGPGPNDPNAPVPLPYLCLDVVGLGVGL